MNEAELFAGAEIVPGEHVTYALRDDATIVLLEPGDRPTGTGVWATDRVDLYGPFPAAVADRLDGRMPPVRGFVRLDGECVPLGRLQVTQSRSERIHDNDGGYFDQTWCLLSPDESIPLDLLDRIRPIEPAPLPDPSGWLARMAGDPLGALNEFATGWYQLPARAAEPVRPWRRLPAALHEFYRLAVGREQLLGTYNRIALSSEIEWDEEVGQLVIGWGHQGVCQWMIDPDGDDDPQVWCDEEPEGEPLSRFLLRFVLAEAANNALFHASATMSRAAFTGLENLLTPVPLASADGSRLYAGAGLSVLVTAPEDDEFEVWAGACHRSALRPLRGVADWEDLED